MKDFFSFKFSFLILILLILASCDMSKFYQMNLPKTIHAYEGPRLPKDKLGLVSWSITYGKNLKLLPIEQLDGRTWKEIMEADNFNPTIFNCNSIFLPAGEHIIELSGGFVGDIFGSYTRITGRWLLKFVVEPRHHYGLEYKKTERIKTEKNGAKVYKVDVYIIDRATKEIVSELIEK